MNIEDCKIGMTVALQMDRYGTTIKAKIQKINNKTAMVEILEPFKGHPIGTIYNASYSLFNPIGEDGNVIPPVPKPVEKLTYHPFQSGIEQSILEAIAGCYSHLSPENLTCDGECSRAEINRKSAKLNRQLKGLFYAFGREVGEMEVYDWLDSKNTYEKSQEKMNQGVPS